MSEEFTLSIDIVKSDPLDSVSNIEIYESEQATRSSGHRKLDSFLRSQSDKIRGKGFQNTNIIDQGRSRSYEFNNDDLYKLFQNLKECFDDHTIQHFSERQGTPSSIKSGIMIDVDLEIGTENIEYEPTLYSQFTDIVVQFLMKTLKLGRFDNLTTYAFIIEKRKPVPIANNSERFKFGFHLLIPGFHVTRSYRKYMLTSLRRDEEMLKLLEKMKPLIQAEDCIDMNSASVPALFIGSCKRSSIPYKLLHIQQIAIVPHTQSHRVVILPSQDYNRVRSRYNVVYEASLNFEARYETSSEGIKIRPLIPTIDLDYNDNLTESINAVASRTMNMILDHEEIDSVDKRISYIISENPKAKQMYDMLNLLDEPYYSEYIKWRNVVYAIANTSSDFKVLAEWFSQKCPAKWVENGQSTLDQLWEQASTSDNSNGRKFTDRSIIYWARSVNKDRFDEVSKNHYFTILTRYVYKHSGILEHGMFAKVLYAMLQDRYCTDVINEDKYWFEFMMGDMAKCGKQVWKWHLEKKNSNVDRLRNFISDELSSVCESVCMYVKQNIENSKTEEDKLRYNTMLSCTKKSMNKLHNHQFKNGIVNESASLFRRYGFADSMDKDGSILGVGNGLIKIGRDIQFINYFHEYAISKYTDTIYHDFDATNTYIIEIMKAFSMVFPEPEVLDYMLMNASTGLSRETKMSAILQILHGSGSNGKTFFLELIANTLGDYAKKVPVGVFIDGRGRADRPDSAFMAFKGTGFAYCEETDKSEILGNNNLKRIINAGTATARELNCKQESFEMVATVFLASNYPLVVPTTDHGTWRRIRYYKNKSKFCDNPNLKNEFEYQKNGHYDTCKSDPNYKSAMLSILVHYYERLQKKYEGKICNVPCSRIEDETLEFRNTQDFINRFISERIVTTNATDEMGRPPEVALNTLAEAYREWYNTKIRQNGAANLNGADIEADFENSVIKKYLKRAQNQTYTIEGIRILETYEHYLREGEEFLISSNDNKTKKRGDALPSNPDAGLWWKGDSKSKLPTEDGATLPVIRKVHEYFHDDKSVQERKQSEKGDSAYESADESAIDCLLDLFIDTNEEDKGVAKINSQKKTKKRDDYDEYQDDEYQDDDSEDTKISANENLTSAQLESLGLK